MKSELPFCIFLISLIVYKPDVLSMLKAWKPFFLSFDAFLGTLIERCISKSGEQNSFQPSNVGNMNKGASFLKNCGVASVGEYNRVILYYQLSR